MYILVFGHFRRPKTALQESWSDEETMEMVERANACKNGIECGFLSRLEDEEGTRGKKSYAVCLFSFVLIISYFISLNVTSPLRKTTFLIHHRRFYPTCIVKE